MPMLKLQLAESAAEWIDERVASDDYADAESYVNNLVTRDRGEADKLIYMRKAVALARTSGISARTFADVVR